MTRVPSNHQRRPGNEGATHAHPQHRQTGISWDSSGTAFKSRCSRPDGRSPEDSVTNACLSPSPESIGCPVCPSTRARHRSTAPRTHKEWLVAQHGAPCFAPACLLNKTHPPGFFYWSSRVVWSFTPSQYIYIYIYIYIKKYSCAQNSSYPW